VALTAYATKEDKARALETGFQMHVAKPIEPETLVMSIASTVGRKV
jgi:CheY-like chemotaxis protein